MQAFLVFLFCAAAIGSCAQSDSQSGLLKAQKNTPDAVGGPCEGCEAIYESPVPFEKLSSVATLPDYREQGPKIELSGIVYQSDGKTPARDVVLYFYHTDQTGRYPKKGDEKGWAARHGYLRGWVKTDRNGFYQLFTLRPASYPGREEPAHIHVTIKEPDKKEYYIDDFLFADDPLLTPEYRRRLQKRGGSGIIELVPQKNGMQGTRHIFLGKNIPHYPPSTLDRNRKSGLRIGKHCPAFDPFHLSGADAGKKLCPMCKYGYGQGLMVWFNHANLDQMEEFIQLLEKEISIRGVKRFRVFLVYMNPFRMPFPRTSEQYAKNKIRIWCVRNNLRHVAMTMVASPEDPKTCGLYLINPEAKNTVFLYQRRKIAAKWVNMDYDAASVTAILQQL